MAPSPATQRHQTGPTGYRVSLRPFQKKTSSDRRTSAHSRCPPDAPPDLAVWAETCIGRAAVMGIDRRGCASGACFLASQCVVSRRAEAARRTRRVCAASRAVYMACTVCAPSLLFRGLPMLFVGGQSRPCQLSPLHCVYIDIISSVRVGRLLALIAKRSAP